MVSKVRAFAIKRTRYRYEKRQSYATLIPLSFSPFLIRLRNYKTKQPEFSLTTLGFFTRLQEPMKSKAPQLHLEYRFYKLLGSHGECHVSRYRVHISRSVMKNIERRARYIVIRPCVETKSAIVS